MTIMTKLLQNITQQESQNVVNKTFQTPNIDVINSIYESSCGDLRSAINTLQFACLRGGTNTAKAVTGKIQSSPKKSSTKKAKLVASKEKETEFAAIGGRDTPDDFFRVIGRVLYAKRDPQQERGPLVHNPQDIVRSYSGNAEFFAGFLHENYLKHFSSNIQAVRKTADYFSVADVIMNPGVMNGMELAKQLGLSVSVQGVMHNHPGKSTSAGLGFKPHHKPRSIAAEHGYQDRRDQARQMFPNSHCTNYELLTELVPYITKIGVADYHTEAQKNFIESSRLATMGSDYSFRMSSSHSRTIQQPVGSVPRNGMKPSTAVENDDDAKLIEEFPDSD
ncbi:hypothetical protein B566_EDAN006727 [Ephemera danica]|nr:hypothetical protein B566_EDAN006727 [Ephemera danica]